ncbi:MAG: ABC transporter substrate-binding protein [Planctomycetes bacterium]|jgi:putative ABC transport system substrate-binding protein|nr:ABC transporter substrate-binding protein [Planctomycetota bacterium]
MGKKFYIIIAAVLFLLVIGWFGWQRYAVAPMPVSQEKVYRVGLLQFAPVVSQNMDGFKAGLEELGYREGKNIKYFYRDAQGDLKVLDEYAAELVALKPDMIFVNTSPATLAIKKATAGTSIPVVFSMVADPLGAGIVASIKSSGNNLAGTSCAYVDVAPKRLEVLSEVAPQAKKILVFYRPEDKSAGPCAAKLIDKAPELGLEILPYEISQKEDIEAYLQTLQPGDIDAIMDPADSMVTAAVETLVDYSIKLKVPYMALSKGEVEQGATMGYAVDYIDLGKQSSLIANQVLNGIAPADIPIEMPRRWYFAVNLPSAQAIGLDVPETVLQKADFVVR